MSLLDGAGLQVVGVENKAMRVVFGLVSLLIVLVIVLWTARAGLHGGRPASPTAAVTAGPPGSPRLPVTPAQVQRDVDAALQEGRARNDAAEREAGGASDAGRAPAGGDAR